MDRLLVDGKKVELRKLRIINHSINFESEKSILEGHKVKLKRSYDHNHEPASTPF